MLGPLLMHFSANLESHIVCTSNFKKLEVLALLLLLWKSDACSWHGNKGRGSIMPDGAEDVRSWFGYEFSVTENHVQEANSRWKGIHPWLTNLTYWLMGGLMRLWLVFVILIQISEVLCCWKVQHVSMRGWISILKLQSSFKGDFQSHMRPHMGKTIFPGSLSNLVPWNPLVWRQRVCISSVIFSSSGSPSYLHLEKPGRSLKILMPSLT